jgi:hypothetical protein
VSPVALYGSLAFIFAASMAVGWAVLAAIGRREWSWLAPAVGLAVLILVSALTIRLPGRALTASLAVAAVIGASLLIVSRHAPGLSAAARVGLPVVLACVAAASLPFAVGGGLDVLGPRVNDDLGLHLYYAEWLDSREGIEPAEVSGGYPIGPHALVLAVSGLTGAGLPATFTGLLIAVASITALASLAVLVCRPIPVRVLGALLVGFAYLAASFYVQSAFKETLMGLFILSVAFVLREAAGEGPTATRAHPPAWLGAAILIALLAAASVQTYSLYGLAWTAGPVGLWGLFTVGARWKRGGGGIDGIQSRRLAAPIGIALAVLALGALPDWGRAVNFVGLRGTGSAIPATVNLSGAPISPYEVLGIWLSNTFSVGSPPSLELYAALLTLVAVAAIAIGALRLGQRREIALLAALIVGGTSFLVARLFSGPYFEARALAIVAPLVMAVALIGVLPQPGDRWLRRERSALGALFVPAALFSTYLALAGAHVDRDDHDTQLASLRPELRGSRVLFLGGGDLFAAWDLRGASVFSPTGTPGGFVEATRPGLPRAGERVDFDTVTRGVLDEMDFVITAGSGYASEPPSNFRPVRSTESFTLWERTGPTPNRHTLREGDLPGAVLDCDARQGRRISRRGGRAHIFSTRPVLGGVDEWRRGAATEPAFPRLVEGEQLHQAIRLPAGRWKISLQYWSLEPVLLDGPELHRELPASTSVIGPYWPVGIVEMHEPGRAVFAIEPNQRPTLRRLLAGPSSLHTGPEGQVGTIAAVRAADRRTVPLSDACGELVDWYEVSAR